MENNNKPTGSAADHLANERTFLAWIRTSIAIMGFGFVVVKFTLFIKQVSIVLGNKANVLPNRGYSASIGILLVVMGVAIAFYSYIRYRITEKQITNMAYKPSFALSILVTLSILIIGILLIIYLMPGV
jgi:putative membrane protein